MKPRPNDLHDAAEAGLISSEQAVALQMFFDSRRESDPELPARRFTPTNVLYYLGGLIAIGAMTLFVNAAWEVFGGEGLLFIALCYAALGIFATERLRVRDLDTAAGIAATFVVCVTPLAVYGLQQSLGFWPADSEYSDYHRVIAWHWLYLELGTLAVGVCFAWRYRYAFLMMPIAATLWYMSMDVTAMLSGGDYDWELRRLVSIVFGLLMIGLAVWLDIRSHRSVDYAFWLYMFGVAAFWCGLTFMESSTELSRFLYMLVNLGLIATGAILVRRVFVVFGGLGLAGYLGYLASSLFEDSLLFPFALSAVGFFIIYLGILWQRHELAVTAFLQHLLPESVRQLLNDRQVLT